MMIEGSEAESGCNLWKKDPDPGDPKTFETGGFGSGSSTLHSLLLLANFHIFQLFTRKTCLKSTVIWGNHLSEIMVLSISKPFSMVLAWEIPIFFKV